MSEGSAPVAAILPRDVSDLDIAFACDVGEMLPAFNSVPDEFTRIRGNAYVDFVDGWFFKGADAKRLTARDGIDRTKALRHIQACMGSFEPKHEHKIAGCAYLLSLWFELDAPE